MKKSLVLTAALAATSLLAAGSHAAMLTLSDNVDAQYDNATDFNLLQSFSPPLTPTINATPGTMYEVPIYFEISNLQPGESGFGNVQVVVTTTGGDTLDTTAGYIAQSQTYTSGKATKAYWSVNQSTAYTAPAGNIVASIAGGQTASQVLAMGVGSPFQIGWIYIDQGATSGTVSVSAPSFSTNNSGVLTLDPTGTSVPATTLVFNVPEPASLGMVGIGALGLLARRRRTA